MTQIMNALNYLGLDLKDIIDIILSVSGFAVSLVAIYQANRSIKLTENSIYEANRPVVSVYLDYIQTLSNMTEYLVIKNFGNSVATINKIEFDKDMPKTSKDKTTLFSDLTLPLLLAPGQSFSTVLRIDALRNPEGLHPYEIYRGKIKVKLEYEDGVKCFKEEFLLNQDIAKNLRSARSQNSNASINNVLLSATEEILRKKI
ncbi:hypothetical protein ACV7JQ_06260 [Globicatella sulfidifaciens]